MRTFWEDSLKAAIARRHHPAFGFGVSDALTLEEVGVRFEVTRERIRQIEAKAMKRL